MKNLGLLKKIAFFLNIAVLACAVFAYFASGWDDPAVMLCIFIVLTLCFWASTILWIVDNVRTGGYTDKRTRVSNIVRDIFSLIVVILVTFYTVYKYIL